MMADFDSDMSDSAVESSEPGEVLIRFRCVRSEPEIEVDFAEPPPDDLMCLICTSVARVPYQLTCCGRIYCKSCLNRLGRDPPCPNCRSTEWDPFHDKKSYRNIQALKIICPNKDEGCDWIGELRERSDHKEVCGYELVECENECWSDEDENVTLVHRKLIKKHLEEECVNRLISCDLCEEEGLFHEITGSHVEECPEVEVNCQNTPCEEHFKRRQRKRHIEECPYEIIPCKFAKYGCDIEHPRKDMANHEKESTLHLDTVTGFCDSLEEKLEEVQLAVYNLQDDSNVPHESRVASTSIDSKPLNMVTLRVGNASSLIRKQEWYTSPPFYTSKGGYKMCLRVGFPLIFSPAGTQVHISAYLHLLQGENDENLEWPFRPAKIKIELLNQTDDSAHIKHIVNYEATLDSDANQKVIGKGLGKGYGIRRIMVLTQNDYSRKYVANGSLVFRVTVLEAPQPKPWLVCNI